MSQKDYQYTKNIPHYHYFGFLVLHCQEWLSWNKPTIKKVIVTSKGHQFIALIFILCYIHIN